jgi:signal peptidase I
MKKTIGKITFYSKFVIILLLIAVFIRLFIGEPCTVPSDSMYPTILSGDRLWIDYTIYGARLPRRFADIPIINVFTWIKSLRERDLKNDWGVNRMKGRRLPQINDIVVFESPEYPHPLLVKRISKIKMTGDTIFVNSDNYKTMENLIKAGGDNILMKMEKIYINGKVDSIFITKQPYYFMSGDHVENSHDSRNFGFVPHSSIVGQINFTIYSFDNKITNFFDFRTNRFFKKIS